MTDGATIQGESRIGEAVAAVKDDGTRIDEVFLSPTEPKAHPDAVRAILEADLIILGPGSLYTSVLPNVLVPGIRRALLASSATRVYVCNVATQHGETDEFDVKDHVEAIESHISKDFLNFVLANDNLPMSIPKAEHSHAVRLDASINNGLRLITADVISHENWYHHDSTKLAQSVMRIYYERDQAGSATVEAEEDQDELVTALDQ
jgi:uncharacterized cofD-like protein